MGCLGAPSVTFPQARTQNRSRPTAADPSGGHPRLEPALRFEVIGVGRKGGRDPVLGQCFFVTTLALERAAKAEAGVVVGRVDLEDAFEGGFGPAKARRK